jgi:peptidoglycan/LPS O-acetylase OafA/YrhL
VRNIEIDRLRALAVLVTIYGHLSFLLLGPTDWWDTSRQNLNNGAGVILFFAISGYVISHALVSDLDNAGRKIDALFRFWLKRITRIMPMAVLWVAIPLLLSWGFNSRGIFGNFNDNLDGAPWALFSAFNVYGYLGHYKSMYGVYWSLALEEQFYAVYPLFLLMVPGWKRRIIALIAILGLNGLIPIATMGMFRIDAMLMGAMLYFFTARKPAVVRPPINRMIGLALTALIMAGLAYGHLYYYLITPGYIFSMGAAIISVFALWLATKQQGFILPLSPGLNKVVDWIGTRSFGLYLVHIPCFQLAGEIAWRYQQYDTQGWRALFSACFIIAATEICYRVVETPIRRWGRRAAENIGKHPVGQLETAASPT